MVRWLKISASWRTAARSSDRTSASRLVGNRLARAKVRSLAVAMARSVVERMGMVACVGNQARLSAMISDLIFQIQKQKY